MPNRHSVTALAILISAYFTFATELWGQFEQISSQDYPRPMDRVLRMIEVRCQCVITYEDPQYESSQVFDATRLSRADGKTEPKTWWPRPSFFSFHYDASAGQDRSQIARNLQLAIAQFNATRKDGVAFRLTEGRRVFHVIPARGSILNMPVNVTLKEGTSGDVIKGILAQVSQAHDKKIDLAGILLSYKVRVSTDRGNAGELLSEILESIDPKLSWKLLYDFTYQFYVLNIVDSSRPPRQIVEYGSGPTFLIGDCRTLPQNQRGVVRACPLAHSSRVRLGARG